MMSKKDRKLSRDQLRATFRRFRKRIEDDDVALCDCCPATSRSPLSSSWCVDVCGRVWPELIAKDQNWRMRGCPCTFWGKDRAWVKLNDFINEKGRVKK